MPADNDHLPPALPDELLIAWDSLSAAINRIVLAQPSNMTRASELLRDEQEAYSKLLRRLSLGK